MLVEFGIFNDEGMTDGPFCSKTEAEEFYNERYTDEDDCRVEKVEPEDGEEDEEDDWDIGDDENTEDDDEE